MNLKKAKTLHLINELKARGFFTGLLFDSYDIDRQIDDINHCEDEPVSLTDEQKIMVYDALWFTDTLDGCTDMINETIRNVIIDISKQSK